MAHREPPGKVGRVDLQGRREHPEHQVMALRAPREVRGRRERRELQRQALHRGRQEKMGLQVVAGQMGQVERLAAVAQAERQG